MAGVDLSRPCALDARVELRPESFGALAYHFGTRRLSFLKSPTLRRVVETLAEHPDAISACRAAGIEEAGMPQYVAALEQLAASGMIVQREPVPA